MIDNLTNRKYDVNLQPKPFKAQGKTHATFNELFKEWKAKSSGVEVEEINPYTTAASSKPSFVTVRYTKPNEPNKKFFQASQTKDGWTMQGLTGKTPLFNYELFSKASEVLIVEGEKCVRRFTELGFSNIAATTAAGGVNGADKADWQALAGKDCYIWRDNDEAGLKYEQTVIKILSELTPPVKIRRVRVEELDLDPKDDIADYLDGTCGTPAEQRAAVELVLQDSEPLHRTRALEERIAQIEQGTFRNIPFLSMPQLSNLSKALMPGTVTTVCGEPGAGKSFFMLEQFWRWALAETAKVKLLMLEDDEAFHQNRALAQMSGRSDLTDTEYCLEHIDLYKETFTEYREPLEYFSRHLVCAGSKQMKLNDVADWVIAEADSGTEIIGVDVVTAAETSDKSFIDDKKYMFRVKEALERTGARLIQVTHPRLGQAGKPGLSGMSGGASYPRFSQTVLWLRSFDTPKESNLYGAVHSPIVKHQQQIDIGKCRNGKGKGKSLITQLNTANLCTEEIGVIVNDSKTNE